MTGAAPVRMPFTAVRMNPVPPSCGGMGLKRLGLALRGVGNAALPSPQSGRKATP